MRKFSVVVDAGSSGSRMMIYSWRDPQWERNMREQAGERSDVLPSVEKGTWERSSLEWQVKQEPGLSSFADTPDELEAYLAPMFEHAQKVIPEEAHARTSFHVLATAGMRMVPEAKRKAVLRKVCKQIHASPFRATEDDVSRVRDADSACGGQVRVISGEEEGLLGWVAVNYLMDGFRMPGVDAGAPRRNSTFGFLDMGGASTQIAFEPRLDASGPVNDTASDALPPTQNKDLFDVAFRRLDSTEVSHQVFVTTFLGFGTNMARTRFLNARLEELRHLDKVPDPCLPSGLQVLAGPEGKQIHGTGDFKQCLALQEPLLDKTAECAHPPCLFHGIHVPPIDFRNNRFIGVSEYWYSAHDVFDLGGAYDYTRFQQAAEQFCGEEWAVLEQRFRSQHYKPQVTLPRLQMQCFKAAWVATVLHEGLGMPRLMDEGAAAGGGDHADQATAKALQKNLFQSLNDVKGFGMSWTLGKAVLEACMDVPAERSGAAFNMQPNGKGVWSGGGSAGMRSYEVAESFHDWFTNGPMRSLSLLPMLLASVVALGLCATWLYRRRRSRRAEPELPVTQAGGEAASCSVVVDNSSTMDILEKTRNKRRRGAVHGRMASTARAKAARGIGRGWLAYVPAPLQRALPQRWLASASRPSPRPGAGTGGSGRVLPPRLCPQRQETLPREGYPRVPALYAPLIGSDTGSSPPGSAPSSATSLSFPHSPDSRLPSTRGGAYGLQSRAASPAMASPVDAYPGSSTNSPLLRPSSADDRAGAVSPGRLPALGEEAENTYVVPMAHASGSTYRSRPASRTTSPRP